jgi:hypothetical protein
MQFIHPGETVTVNGSQRNHEFSITGTNPYGGGYSNANLIATNGPAFRGTVDLGTFASLYLHHMDLLPQVTGYTFANNKLDLYNGNRVVEEVTLRTSGHPIQVSSWGDTVHVTTGAMALTEGMAHAVGVFTPGGTVYHPPPS